MRDTHKTSNYIFQCSSWKFIGADRSPICPFPSSRVCQLRHWNEGHRNACRVPDSISKNGGRIPDSSSSPGSSESDSRNFSDVLSPRSTRSDNISDTLSVDEIIAPQLSPALSPAPGFVTSANSHSAPVSPQPGSLLKTSSTVSADGRRTKPKKVSHTRTLHFMSCFKTFFHICRQPTFRRDCLIYKERGGAQLRWAN